MNLSGAGCTQALASVKVASRRVITPSCPYAAVGLRVCRALRNAASS